MSKVRAESFTNKAGSGGPDFPYGLSGIGIHSGGTVIHSGIITALNFVGTGNTFSVDGTTVDISISGGSDGIAGINTAGISTFNQLNVTGNATLGGLTVTGNSTFGNITAGDINASGTLTYEDVTNVDAVGLITARNGINVLSGGIDASGVITASNGLQGIGIHSGGTVIHSGIITALNFVGTGNTFSVDGTTINISISGGGGGFSQLDTWLFAP
jgi:hypothetical protein